MRGTQSSFNKPRATTEVMSCDPLSDITTFPWCSGYHIRLTRGRSPVRARAETIIIPCGLVARIAGFHPAGPGSIPGMGNNFFTLLRAPNIFGLTNDVCCTQITQSFHSCQTFSVDEVAEWLRRWTANPMCSARVGSNPILVVTNFFVLQGCSTFKMLVQKFWPIFSSSFLLCC